MEITAETTIGEWVQVEPYLSVRAWNVMGNWKWHYERLRCGPPPKTVGELAEMTLPQVLRVPGCGRFTVNEIREKLKVSGMDLKGAAVKEEEKRTVTEIRVLATDGSPWGAEPQWMKCGRGEHERMEGIDPRVVDGEDVVGETASGDLRMTYFCTHCRCVYVERG